MDINELLKNAICTNNLDLLISLRENYSIDERFEDENNDTLLLYSISDGKSDIYKYFLENGANIKCVNDENENILHAICFSGDKSRLIDIIKKYPDININARSSDGATPLLLSLSLGYYEMAEIFIRNGADVNIGDIDEVSPLHIAVQFGNLDLVKLLIENGAILKKKTANGNYPLALAVNAENIDIVKYIYELMY